MSGLYKSIEIRTMNRSSTGTLKVYLDGTLKYTKTTPINFNTSPGYQKYTFDISNINNIKFTLSGKQSDTSSYYTRLSTTYIYP